MGKGRSNSASAGFATRAIHLGHDPADHLGALIPPVFMTSTYAFESAEEGEALFRGERQGYVYGRTRNPTQGLFEERIASLEGAEAGLAVASGMAAISSTLLSVAGRRLRGDRSYALRQHLRAVLAGPATFRREGDDGGLHRPRRCRRRRGARAAQADFLRIARQSDAQNHRHRGSLGDRAEHRRLDDRRQHFRHARLAATDRAWR